MVICSRLPERTRYGACFLWDGPMIFPARPCMSKPVSSQFQICDGLLARLLATKNSSKSSNQASTSSLEILALFFSRGRALRTFTFGFLLTNPRNHLLPALLFLKGVGLPSLSRNFLTAWNKESLDTPKLRFANSISQSANWFSSWLVRTDSGPQRLPISIRPFSRSWRVDFLIPHFSAAFRTLNPPSLTSSTAFSW